MCVTGGASDSVQAKSSGEDPRATGGLYSNLPHPRVNKTKQHTHHSQGVYFPPNHRRWSVVFRVLFQQTKYGVKTMMTLQTQNTCKKRQNIQCTRYMRNIN